MVDALIARADELARDWAIALMLARPAAGIGEVPLEDLARAAPILCAQALRAVQCDVELERLTGRGASSGREDATGALLLGTISGARDPVALVAAAEALRGVLWEALLGQLERPSFDWSSARLLGDLGDRLAHVCSAMLAAALQATATGAHAPPTEDPQALASPEPAVRVRSRAAAAGGQAVIVDERERAPAGVFGAPPMEIEIRDQRGEEGPAAWIRSIGAQLERFERDGRPFTVLLVELVDLERLHREEPAQELVRLAAGMEGALAAALEASWSLTRERPGRCWVLAPGIDVDGAAGLVARLADAVASSASHRRAPLAAAIGTAICPEDGREPAGLAAHADIGLYAARAAARCGSSAR